MTAFAFTIRHELPDDSTAIDQLHAVSFGPGRFARAAFRVREGFGHDGATSFVALHEGEIIGSVRLTPIEIGGVDAMLLGPLAVVPKYKGCGAGRALMRRSMDAVAQSGGEFVLLVGDRPYYGPFGFESVAGGSIRFPAPVDPSRVLLADLRAKQVRASEAPALPSGAVVAKPTAA